MYMLVLLEVPSNTKADTVHEALCQAAYEGNVEQLERIIVLDVSVVGQFEVDPDTKTIVT